MCVDLWPTKPIHVDNKRDEVRNYSVAAAAIGPFPKELCCQREVFRTQFSEERLVRKENVFFLRDGKQMTVVAHTIMRAPLRHDLTRRSAAGGEKQVNRLF